MSELRIGTSGWSYKSWRGPFFPKDVRVKDHLAYYASRFNATELNAPFYRTPKLEAVESWAEQTPDDFVFAWKASKFITHWKRLSKKSENSLDLMEGRLNRLARKAGPVLFQLPPRMQADRERLASFMKMLPKRRRYVFEFRHPSWYEAEILDLLREHDCALCFSDHADAPAPGRRRLASSMSEDTGQAAAITATIAMRHSPAGPTASGPGDAAGATSSASSTTTRRAPRPRTPAAWASFSNRRPRRRPSTP